MISNVDNVMIVKCAMAVLCIAFVGKLLKKFFFPYYIPGIPILRANSLFGFNVDKASPGRYDSHLRMMKLAEEKGKLVQYYWMGYNFVMVSDKFLAKFIMETVTGKGYFHRGNEEVNRKNIFNLDTNAEWKRRRTAFRQSFTASTLRHFQEEIRELSAKLSTVLREAADSGSEVRMDRLFGQLTVDVICKVAFQYDVHALDNSEVFQALHRDMRVRLENNILAIIPHIDKLHWLASRVVPHSTAQQFAKFTDAMDTMKDVARTLLAHIHRLQAVGALNKDCFGHALLQWFEQEQREHPESQVGEEELVSEVMIMMIAGHETTAHTLSWVLYSLATHPEVEAKCYAAIDAATATVNAAASTGGDGNLQQQKSLQLPLYVEAVLKESMRKFSMLSRGTGRLVTQKGGVTLPLSLLNALDPNIPQRHAPFTHDIVLPEGTWLQVHTHSLQNSVDNWGDSGRLFLPERFLPHGHYLHGLETTPTAKGMDGNNSNSDGADPQQSVFSTTPTPTPTPATNTISNNPLSSHAVYMGGGVFGNDLCFQPFAHGPRNCIGMHLALLETRTVLNDLLREFRFRLPGSDGGDGEKEDRHALWDESVAAESVLTMRPYKMLPMYVERR